MGFARWLAKIGLAGLLLFLPFGIAGQQLSLAAGTIAIVLAPGARRRIGRFLARRGPGRPLLLGAAVWTAVSLASLVFSGRAAEGAWELRKLLLLPALLLPLGAIENRREFSAALLLLFVATGSAAIVGIIEQLRGAGPHPTRLDGPIGFYMTSAGVFLLLSLVALATHGPRRRPLPAVTCLLATTALLLTYTRGAWFAWAGGAAFLARRRGRRAAVAVLLFAGAILLAPSTRERLATSWGLALESNRERLWVWEAGVRAFRERPWIGHGLHDLAPLLEAHRCAAARDRLTHFHSLYLQTAAAMGVAGLAALALLIGGIAAALRGTAARAPDRLARSVAEGALAALVAFLIHGLFEWNLGDSEVATTLYAIAGLAFAGAGAVRSDRDASRK